MQRKLYKLGILKIYYYGVRYSVFDSIPYEMFQIEDTLVFVFFHIYILTFNSDVTVWYVILWHHMYMYTRTRVF